MEIGDLLLRYALPYLGPAGVLVALWILADRSNQKTLNAYREDTLKQAVSHEKALIEAIQMYKDNVELVKNYHKVAEGLQDLIVLNTQSLTRVLANQFCPVVRNKTGMQP
jgi:hypothetical protein